MSAARLRIDAGFDPEVKRQAADPTHSLWVSASAGAGKTQLLIDRVLALLVGGAAPERILCLTFTRAAAAEMIQRVDARLAKWASATEADLRHDLARLLMPEGEIGDEILARARRLFAHVLDSPGGLRIETIHAFCQSLLARFPIEAGIAPHFEGMDERSAAEISNAAWQDLLRSARDRPESDLARAVAYLAVEAGESDLRGLLGGLDHERGRLRRLMARTGGSTGAAIAESLGLAPGEDEASVLANATATDAFDAFGLAAAAAAMARGGKTDAKWAKVIVEWLGNHETRAAKLDDYLKVFFTGGGAGPRRKNLIDKKSSANDAGAEAVLCDEADRLEVVREAWNATRIAAASTALLVVGAARRESYDRLKARRGRLDYDDLIGRARDLLEGDGAAAWVLYKLDGGIDHILVDEAQDTSPDQWRVIAALAEEFFAGKGARELDRSIFVVGDEKQSIFSFQGANPDSFAQMRATFRARVEDAGKNWTPAETVRSYRSTEAVLAAVDAVFSADDMRKGVAADGGPITHDIDRLGQAGVVELWPPAPAPAKREREAWTLPVTRQPGEAASSRLARAIAARIRGWLDDGEILESRQRPIRAGDIMVLVQKRKGFVDDMVRELKQREIQVAGVDRVVLAEHLAVMDLIALGEFLLLPEDDLTLATVLKGPLVGLDEDLLFDLAYDRGKASLWSVLGARRDARPEYARAHEYLSGLLARADYMPPFELYAGILDAGGGRRALLARLGAEAADPIDEFVNLTLAYERVAPPSLQGFLHWLAAGAVEVKRDLDLGHRDEVRIMTVHGAKGLQAPIVFLPDTLRAGGQTRAELLWGDDDSLPLWCPRKSLATAYCSDLREAGIRRRAAERRRLLYVAMTRAEDRLYVCGWEGKNQASDDCWYRQIARGLETRAEPFEFTAMPADGWSGNGLRLKAAQRAEPDKKAEEGRPSRSVSPDLPDWASRPAPVEAAALRRIAPSHTAAADTEEGAAADSPIGGDVERFRRGRVIHRLLQFLPGLAPESREAAASRYLAEPGHGLDPPARHAIGVEVLKVLTDPVFAPLFGVGSAAEIALAGEIAGRAVVGQVDRLVVTGDSVLLVDYKTDRTPPADAEAVAPAYLRQMAAYAAILDRVYPGKSLICGLLWTSTPRLMQLPPELLARHALTLDPALP